MRIHAEKVCKICFDNFTPPGNRSPAQAAAQECCSNKCAAVAKGRATSIRQSKYRHSRSGQRHDVDACRCQDCARRETRDEALIAKVAAEMGVSVSSERKPRKLTQAEYAEHWETVREARKERDRMPFAKTS